MLTRLLWRVLLTSLLQLHLPLHQIFLESRHGSLETLHHSGPFVLVAASGLQVTLGLANSFQQSIRANWRMGAFGKRLQRVLDGLQLNQVT